MSHISLAVNRGFTTNFFDLAGDASSDGALESRTERMCNMRSITLLSAMACALVLSFCAPVAVHANTVNVTYSLNGSGSGDPLNPPLIGNATGSLSPLGSVIWSDMIFPNLATGAGDGTFKMTFTDGDTLFGTLHYQGDFSTFPIVPFTQLLTVMGGTGALLNYSGILTGLEISNQGDGTFTSSGGGSLQVTPEPGSLVLLSTGLASLFAYRMRAFLHR
jgi:hypothetical protein